MSAFPSPVSAPQLATLRASGYWTRVFACLNPNEVVFRAQASETITSDPFKTFTWDNADIGVYGDVWEGMIVYISSTTSLRDAKYRGRVRLAPSASEFYISRNSETLNDGDYVIVVRDTDLFAREREDTLIDGSIAYHSLPPMLTDHPSVIVLYDQDDDGEEAYTPVQVGIPVDVLATTVDTWAWSVSGNGAYTIDDPALEHPTFTFEAGYHYLIRVIYTDDNGESNYQISHVYSVDRTFGAPVIQPIVTTSGGGDIQDGWQASITAYADVSTLLDRTHCVIWHVQHFGDDSDTPLVTNVLMNGRLRSSSIQTSGDAEAGQLQEVTFAVEGITAYLRTQKIPPDIVRPVDDPDEWGEITEPNPYRMAVYAMWAYTTLTNIGCFGVEDGQFEAYQIGVEPRAIEGSYAYDVLTALLWETIKAVANVAPTGDVYCARSVSYLEDRSAVPLIAVMTLSDDLSYNIEEDSSDTVSQVVAFGGAYSTDSNSIVLYTAQSPSIVYREGEIKEITKEILTVDSTTDEARTELKLRASNHYAAENSKPFLKESLFDSWVGLLIPTNFQRWASQLPAGSNTLGKAYTSTDYWQLQSVSWTIGSDGTVDLDIEKVYETSFDDAQTKSSLLPINLSNLNPVLPVLPNDPAFPTDPLELYPTDTPLLGDLQPINVDSAAQSMMPYPPDVAAQIAANQGSPGCKTLRINLRNSTNVESAWTTILGNNYLFSISGKGGIGGASTQEQTYNFLVGTAGWTDDMYGSIYTPGSGWGPNMFGNFSIYLSSVPFDVYRISVRFNMDAGTNTMFPTSATDYSDQSRGNFSGGNPREVTLSLANIFPAGTRLGIGAGSYPPTFYIESITLFGETVPEVTLEADAFYQGEPAEDGTWENVSLLDDGLYLDNSQYTSIPPYDESHRYANLPFTGTNNPLLARMVFDSYTDNQNVYLFLEMCRKT